jgi:hypothetical protein
MADESDILIEDDVSEIDNELQAPVKRGRPPVQKPEPVYKPRTIAHVKKERTEAQKEATRRMIEARDKNRAERPSVTKVKQDLKAIREQEIAELKAQAVKDYQDSLVKKAISIKKKQIKKKAELDEISDDDTPIEDIKKIVKRLPSKAAPVPKNLPVAYEKPKITFI